MKFSDYGSRSLQACFTYYKYDKLWGLPRRVFTLFVDWRGSTPRTLLVSNNVEIYMTALSSTVFSLDEV